MTSAVEWAARLDPRLALLSLLGVLNLWSAGLILLARAPGREKALWIAVLFLCPIIGGVLWFVFGPAPRTRSPAAPPADPRLNDRPPPP